MILHYTNKQTNEIVVFGSLTAVAYGTGISVHKLYYHFSRKKKERYEDLNHLIIKTELIRSKRD